MGTYLFISCVSVLLISAGGKTSRLPPKLESLDKLLVGQVLVVAIRPVSDQVGHPGGCGSRVFGALVPEDHAAFVVEHG